MSHIKPFSATTTARYNRIAADLEAASATLLKRPQGNRDLGDRLSHLAKEMREESSKEEEALPQDAKDSLVSARRKHPWSELYFPPYHAAPSS